MFAGLVALERRNFNRNLDVMGMFRLRRCMLIKKRGLFAIVLRISRSVGQNDRLAI